MMKRHGASRGKSDSALTICSRRRHPKSHSALSYALVAFFLAGLVGCGATRTQPTVVVRSADACGEARPLGDAYEAALARARCEHPDMLVHPHAYTLRRVPSAPNVKRFALERAAAALCAYEVDAAGAVRGVP